MITSLRMQGRPALENIKLELLFTSITKFYYRDFTLLETRAKERMKRSCFVEMKNQISYDKNNCTQFSTQKKSKYWEK